jgi:hypothetical protein
MGTSARAPLDSTRVRATGGIGLAPRDPVIVGIGLSDYPKAPHLTAVQHHVQALQRALADSAFRSPRSTATAPRAAWRPATTR